MFRSVLVAHDLAAGGDQALSWAARLAELDHAKIILLHVVVAPPVLAADPLVPALPLVSMTENVSQVRARLEEAARRAGIPADIQVVSGGNVGDAILSAAERLDVDAIVMATHGRGPLSQAFLGSTAHHVVRNADVPVVTLRQGARRVRGREAGAPGAAPA
ncbi:MAG: universal stress protein [Myxococcota bacterium]